MNKKGTTIVHMINAGDQGVHADSQGNPPDGQGTTFEEGCLKNKTHIKKSVR